MMLHTTFSLLRKHGACQDGYRKLAKALGGIMVYGKDTPIQIARIIDTNSLDDALWSLRAVLPDEESTRDKLARLFACWCVRQAWHLLTDERSRRAVEVAERFAVGAATAKEMAAARAAAWVAAEAAGAAAEAAWEAAEAAWDAAEAVGEAARAAAWVAAGTAQAAKLREMLEAEG